MLGSPEFTETRRLAEQLPPRTQDLLENFFVSEYFQTQALLRWKGLYPFHDLGFPFEDFAYFRLLNNLKPGETLLTPSQMYRINSHPGLRIDLKGESLRRPDTLILEPMDDITFIRGEAEFYLKSHRDKKKRQQAKQAESGQTPKLLLTERSAGWQRFLGRFIHSFHPGLPESLAFDEKRYRTVYIRTSRPRTQPTDIDIQRIDFGPVSPSSLTNTINNDMTNLLLRASLI